MTSAGLPHSGTPGSPAACASPGSIAACRALHRLSVPRHPPCALISLGRIFLSDPRKHFLHSCTHVRGRWSENHPPGTPIFLIPITRIVNYFSATKRIRRQAFQDISPLAHCQPPDGADARPCLAQGSRGASTLNGSGSAVNRLGRIGPGGFRRPQ